MNTTTLPAAFAVAVVDCGTPDSAAAVDLWTGMVTMAIAFAVAMWLLFRGDDR